MLSRSRGLKWRANNALSAQPLRSSVRRWGPSPRRPDAFHSWALQWRRCTHITDGKISVGVPVILCLRPKARLRWMAAVSQLAAAGTFSPTIMSCQAATRSLAHQTLRDFSAGVGAQDRVQDRYTVMLSTFCRSRSSASIATVGVFKHGHLAFAVAAHDGEGILQGQLRSPRP